MFLIHLLSFKWGPGAPFPSLNTIANRMSIQVRQARNLACSLEKRGLLSRTHRRKTGQTSLYDLNGLFEVLLPLAENPNRTKTTEPEPSIDQTQANRDASPEPLIKVSKPNLDDMRYYGNEFEDEDTPF